MQVSEWMGISYILTSFVFLHSGTYVLNKNIPANLLSLVNPVKHANAPPWLNPPITILSGRIPCSWISDVMSVLTNATPARRLGSSSARVKMSKLKMSNLGWMSGEIDETDFRELPRGHNTTHIPRHRSHGSDGRSLALVQLMGVDTVSTHASGTIHLIC
jgi:hypothetical protein